MSIRNIADLAYRQADYTTGAARQIALYGAFDYIMPLDADEFPAVTDRKALHADLERVLPLRGFAKVPWQTFCPPKTGRRSDECSINTFQPRDAEIRLFYKVVLGREFAKTCRIATGNHNAVSSSWDKSAISLPMSLQHVPIRSSDQMVRKALVGDYSFALGGRLSRNEGYHWSALAERARAAGFCFDRNELHQMARRYCLKDHEPTPAVRRDARIVLSSQCVAKYGALSKVNLMRDLDAFIAKLIASKEASEIDGTDALR